MFIARFSIDVRYGHKDDFVTQMKRWQAEVGKTIGWKQPRLVTGSIGSLESRYEMELQVESLAELEKAWAQLAKNETHKRLARDLEPHVVSGTNRWDIFRVVDV